MKYVLYLILIFIIIGCNNWSENPEEKKVIPIQTSQYVSGLLKEVQLPNNTITLTNINGIFFSGTSNGEIYQNISLFSSPVLKGIIPNSTTDSLFDSYFISENSYSNTVYFFTNGYSYIGYDNKVSNIYNFPPILIYPENNSTNLSTSLQFTWQSVSNIIDNNYLIQISKDKDFPDNNTLNINAKTTLSYRINDLEKNTNYFWRVKSFSIFGSSEYSQPYTFKTME